MVLVVLLVVLSVVVVVLSVVLTVVVEILIVVESSIIISSSVVVIGIILVVGILSGGIVGIGSDTSPSQSSSSVYPLHSPLPSPLPSNISGGMKYVVVVEVVEVEVVVGLEKVFGLTGPGV